MTQPKPTPIPYDWLKAVPTAFLQLDDRPLLGYPPLFPWEAFTQKLTQVFQLQDLKIKPLDCQWKEVEEIISGVGGKPFPLWLNIPGIEGDFCWIFSERDLHGLMAVLITKQTKPLDIIDPEVEKGFTHFLAYEAIHIFNQVSGDKTLNPHLLEKSELPEEACLCQDISIELEGVSFIGRLAISQKFRRAWKEKYTARTLDLPLNPELAEKIQLPVHLEIGSLPLSLREWKNLEPGDFIVMDQNSFNPDDENARLTLTLNGQPLFRAKLKDGNIKILEHPLYYEVETPMAKQPESEDFEDSSADLSQNDFEYDELTDEDHEFDEAADETLHEDHSADEEPQAKPSVSALTKEDKPRETPSIALEDTPLSVVVEIGRLQMSIKKLMELQPGNLLDLDVRPESGVDLVLNGKCIAKAELLRIGETLGVRILDIR